MHIYKVVHSRIQPYHSIVVVVIILSKRDRILFVMIAYIEQ